MILYNFIKNNGHEYKKRIENELSNKLKRKIYISTKEWNEIIKVAIEDIEYNKLSFDQEISEEYVIGILKSVIELNVLRK